MNKRKTKSNAGKRIIFKVSIILLAFYLVYSMITLQTELVSARRVLNEAQEKSTQLQISNKELESLLKNGSQDELVEKAAREKLGFELFQIGC